MMLRPLTPGERADPVETLFGRAFLRVGGDPPWLQFPETVKTGRGELTKFICAIGYERGRSPSGLLSSGQAFMIGELALYFFLDMRRCEIIITSQTT
jgi:hypothetical protein